MMEQPEPTTINRNQQQTTTNQNQQQQTTRTNNNVLLVPVPVLFPGSGPGPVCLSPFCVSRCVLTWRRRCWAAASSWLLDSCCSRRSCPGRPGRSWVRFRPRWELQDRTQGETGSISRMDRTKFHPQSEVVSVVT